MTKKQKLEAYLACAAQAAELMDREDYNFWVSLFEAFWED